MPKITGIAHLYDADAIITAWETRFNQAVERSSLTSIGSFVRDISGLDFTLCRKYSVHPRLFITALLRPEKEHNGIQLEIECYIHMDELVINPAVRTGYNNMLTHADVRTFAALLRDLSPAFAECESILFTHIRNKNIPTYFNAPFNELERTHAHERWVDQSVLYCQTSNQIAASDLWLGIHAIQVAIVSEYGDTDIGHALSREFTNTVVKRIIETMLDGFGLKEAGNLYLMRVCAFRRAKLAADTFLAANEGGSLIHCVAQAVVALWADLKAAR